MGCKGVYIFSINKYCLLALQSDAPVIIESIHILTPSLALDIIKLINLYQFDSENMFVQFFFSLMKHLFLHLLNSLSIVFAYFSTRLNIVHSNVSVYKNKFWISIIFVKCATEFL